VLNDESDLRLIDNDFLSLQVQLKLEAKLSAQRLSEMSPNALLPQKDEDDYATRKIHGLH
jgi:hypothetical protein